MSRRVALPLTFVTAWHMVELSEGGFTVTHLTDQQYMNVVTSALNAISAQQCGLGLWLIMMLVYEA
jgi:hypothetical protein